MNTQTTNTRVALASMINEIKTNNYFANCIGDHDDVSFYVDTYVEFHEIKNVNKVMMVKGFINWISRG